MVRTAGVATPSSEQPITTEGYSRPEQVRPLDAPSAGLTIAMVGKIAPGPAPAEDCGTPTFLPPTGPTGPTGPTTGPVAQAPRAFAALNRQIQRRAGRKMVAAQVRCPAACRVELRARQGRRSFTIRRSLPKGTTAIALPHGLIRGMRAGRVGLRVRVNGRTVAERGATLK